MFSLVNLSREKDGRKREKEREAGDVGTCLNVHECLAMLICPKKETGDGRERFQTDMCEREGVIPDDNVSREREKKED